MDSMRSLNSSLPSSRPSRSAPPDLLQAFRTAALQVTNLYKSAVSEHESTRQEGYQDALEDLLKFLDSENLGVQDGEGWRIRQWATQRYDAGRYQQHRDGEEETNRESRHRTASPVHEAVEAIESGDSTIPTEDAPQPEQGNHESMDTSQPMFHFTGSQKPDQAMQTDERLPLQSGDEPSSSSPVAPVRHEIGNQNKTTSGKPQNARRSTRSNFRDFTFTAGSKRKLNLPDFFDISNIDDKGEESGGTSGAKRGRYV